MVVVTGREPDSRRQDGAMSSFDAEDGFLEPATPTGQGLPLLPQEVPGVDSGPGEKRGTGRFLGCFIILLLLLFIQQGKYSIFIDVLNFLRSGDLPLRERVRAVYKEAQYYAIGPLLEQLKNMQPLKGEKVRQAFLGLMPYYKDHLERIVEIARLRAVQRKARFAKLKGLTVDHQCIGVCDKHLVNHYYCKRPIYEFKITWWVIFSQGWNANFRGFFGRFPKSSRQDA
uniref:KCTD7/14 C-terminal domain-containing protein n=1 Tax=Aotus nancymaae TaxID=37293 RepID=A0A2K5DW17_AOTNA